MYKIGRQFPPFLFAVVMINKDPLVYFLELIKYSEQIDKLQIELDLTGNSPSFGMNE